MFAWRRSASNALSGGLGVVYPILSGKANVLASADSLEFAEQLAEIKGRRRKGMVAVVYCTYGDESRDETLKRVYAVAGVFGHQEDWDALEIPWKARLNGRIFHAAECEFGHGEFSDLKPGEGRKLIRDLTTLVVNSKLFGHGTAINLTEYFQSFPNDFEHAPYLWGFADVLKHVSELTSVMLPRESTTEVIFDRNEPIEYNANAIYEWTRVSKKLGGFLADKLSFACRRTVGIQVADLFAREVMKNMDSRLSGSDRLTRASFSSILKTKRFMVSNMGRSDFEAKKQKLAESKFRDTATITAYRKWLEDHRLQDCLTNRIEHLRTFGELWEQRES